MKNFFTNQIGLKIGAVLLAVVSWFAIREAISFEVSLAGVPIELLTPDGWAVFSRSDDSVTVTLRGSQEDIRKMDREQVKAVIDLRHERIVGHVDVPVAPSAIRRGIRGVRVVHVEPATIRVALDHEDEKMVPVKGRTVGKVFSGEVEEILCEPAVVRLCGPARQLGQIELLYTEPVDVEGRIEGFARRRRVLQPSDTWSSRIDPPEVQVKVAIAERTGSLTWKEVPVSVLNDLTDSFSVSIAPARVTVVAMGTAEALEGIKTTQPKAFVDCIGLDSSLNYDLPIQVYLPQGHNITVAADPPFARIVLGQ